MKNKKINKDKLATFLFIIIGILLFGGLGYKVYTDFFKGETEEEKVLQRLDLYNYSLEKSDTELYKENFNKLKDILNSEEINYEEYAKVLGSLYIIDFYTLTNKISSTDIGSVEFVHPDILNNFKTKASDTMYKYVEVNFNNDRTQALPEVSEIASDSIEETKYKIKDTEYEAYKVKYTWKYVEDLKYETSSTVTIVKDGTKLYVVGSD